MKSNFYIFNANRDHHFFRQINISTKEVTKELISRKNLSIIAFQYFSTVGILTSCPLCGNYRNLLPCHSFLAIFPSNQSFTKVLYCKLIWRKIFSMAGSEFLVFPHCVVRSVEIAEIYSHAFLGKNFVKVSFTKELIWRKLMSSPQVKISYVLNLMLIYSTLLCKIFREINLQWNFF